MHNAYTTMCLERRQWYDQAKPDTVRQYANIKTSLLSYERLERLHTDTNVLLAHHTQQALYTWLQHEHIVQLVMRPQTATNKNSPIPGRNQAGRTHDLPHTETTTGTVGPHFMGSPVPTITKTTKSALGPKLVGNPSNMTTPTSTGKHGGPATSGSPYAHLGIAEICIYL